MNIKTLEFDLEKRTVAVTTTGNIMNIEKSLEEMNFDLHKLDTVDVDGLDFSTPLTERPQERRCRTGTSDQTSGAARACSKQH